MSIPKMPDPTPVVASQRPPVQSVAAAPSSAASGTDRATEVTSREYAARDTVRAGELAADERARIAERLQQMARASDRQLEFRVDEVTDRMVIVVRDRETGELIRQIPDATALRIAQRLESQVEAMRSVLFEGRV